MLDRFAVQQLLRAGLTARAVARQAGISLRSVRARQFQDLTTDLPQQLGAWLVEVNTVRPCRATREIPAARLAAEQARMKPLAVAPAEYGLTIPVTVGPTAMVTHGGIRYAMPAAACGLPATLWPTRSG